MADHEIDFQTPITHKFGNISKTSIEALLFREEGVFSVDAATKRVVKLLDYTTLTNPQKNFIKNLAMAHRDAMQELLTNP